METNDVIKLIEEIKAAATGATDEVGRKMLELATRVQSLEQKGPALQPTGPSSPMRPAARVANAAELKAFREAGVPRGKTITVEVDSFAAGPFERKATLLTPGAAIEPMRASEIFGGTAPNGFNYATRVAVRDLIPTRPIASSSVDYVRTTITGTAGVQVNEGDVKPQIDMAPALVNAKVVTVAGWTKASRQVIDDAQLLDDFIQTTLLDALGVAEDREILYGDGTTGHMQGLFGVAAAYNRHQASDRQADDLRRACTQVQLAGGYPTGIIVSPEGLEALELAKTTSGSDPYLNTLVVDDFNRTVIWRVPVIASRSVGTLGFFVGDFGRGARLYDRQQASVQVSTANADDFTRNLVTVLAEERLALAITRPALFAFGTFTGLY